MAQVMTSFPFLCLPRELRDYIYAYIFQSKAEPPISPDDPNLSDRREFDEVYDRERGIMFEENLLLPATYCALLCANRQISTEMRDHVSRHEVVWKLDCMIQYYQLWPTWLSLQHPQRMCATSR